MDRPATNLRAVFGKDFEGMETPVLPVSIPGGTRSLDPEIFGDELLCDDGRSNSVEGTSVSDVRRYVRKPESSKEPLFPTSYSKGAIAERLLEAPWIFRAWNLRAGIATSCLDEGVPP